MFMEADVPSEPAAPAPAAPEPQPIDDGPGVQSGASDSKGWTVFMERQPIAPPPGYTGPTPSYGPTPAELAATMEQPAQPPVEPAQPVAPQPEAQPVTKQTVVMDRPPDVAPPRREPSMSSVPASVPATPAVETGGPPRTQQPPTQLPAPIPPRELDRPARNMMPIYIGVGVVAVILIILVIVIASG
jgi:hypothetical protein